MYVLLINKWINKIDVRKLLYIIKEISKSIYDKDTIAYQIITEVCDVSVQLRWTMNN